MGKNRSTGPVEGQVKARVLVSCSLGEANDVVTLSTSDAAAAASVVDTSPDSVAYAESLAEAAK